MNWQEFVKLPRELFADPNIRIVVYTLEKNVVHALNSDGDAEFRAEDEIERYSEEFHLNDRGSETDFTRDAKCCQPTCDEQFPTFREKDYNKNLIEQDLRNRSKEFVQYDFQFSDITDEMIFLIDMLIVSRDVYSQYEFDVGKTRQKFHLNLKPHVELKRQRPRKVPLHFKEDLEKLVTQLKDADMIREMGDDDDMGFLLTPPCWCPKVIMWTGQRRTIPKLCHRSTLLTTRGL